MSQLVSFHSKFYYKAVLTYFFTIRLIGLPGIQSFNFVSSQICLPSLDALYSVSTGPTFTLTRVFFIFPLQNIHIEFRITFDKPRELGRHELIQHFLASTDL